MSCPGARVLTTLTVRCSAWHVCHSRQPATEGGRNTRRNLGRQRRVKGYDVMEYTKRLRRRNLHCAFCRVSFPALLRLVEYIERDPA